MNHYQLAKIQELTNRIDRYYGSFTHSPYCQSAMSYRVKRLRNGEIILSAGNATSGKPWYEPHYFCNVVVGTRGGIKAFDGEGVAKKFIL